MKNALYAVSHNSILKEKYHNNYYFNNVVTIQPSVETYFLHFRKGKTFHCNHYSYRMYDDTDIVSGWGSHVSISKKEAL